MLLQFHFPSSAFVLSLLSIDSSSPPPLPHILTCLFDYLFLLLLLLPFPFLPPISHLSLRVASCLVIFSRQHLTVSAGRTKRCQSCGRGNQTLTELIVVVGERREGEVERAGRASSGKSNAPRAQGCAGRGLHHAGTNCLLLMH